MPKNKNPFKTSTARPLKKWLLGGLIIILIAGLVLFALEKFGVTHFFESTPDVTDVASDENPADEDKSPEVSDSEVDSSDKDSPKSQENSTTVNLPLRTPDGTFVSNHSPNLDGSPAPNSLESTCTTTPGASCKISFSKNGVTKSLPLKKTNSEGTAYWNWTLQDIGLTQGSWKIKATASSGDSSKSASDSLNLEVGP